MTKKRARGDAVQKTAELVRDLVIIQLGLAGVGQREIQKIVGGSIGHINSIGKLLRKRSNRGLQRG